MGVGGETMTDLERDLAAVLNKYSVENSSGTPDFILAEYLTMCLNAWNVATVNRDGWYFRHRKIYGPSNSAVSVQQDQIFRDAE